MLKAHILDSEATLNNFHVLGSLDIIPGSKFKLVMQLYQPQHPDKLRYMADTGATLAVTLPKTDGTDLTVTMTVMTGDSSIWTGDVLAADSVDLMGGNFQFTLTEGSDVTLGIAENAIAVINTGSCC